MPKPRIWRLILRIHLLQLCRHLGHGCGRGNPAVVDVGVIHRAVVALLAVVEADGAPEALDVAEHFARQRPYAGHPVAIQAPDEVVADQAREFVAADVHPIGVAVTREFDQPYQRGPD